MFWIFGYCLLCWSIGFGFVAWAKRQCDSARAAELEAAHPIGWTIWLALVVAAAPAILPFGVIWLAYQLVQCVRASRQMLQAGEQYRELRFEPVSLCDLEEQYRSGIENAGSEFLELGFELLGDFQNKFEPVPVFNRCFAGPRGIVFGDLTALLETCAPGFVSVLEDGTYVETSGVETCEMKGELQDNDLMCLTMTGKRPVAELLDIHLQAVEREAERRAVRVLAFQREQFKEVFIFGQRRFWSWRQRSGENTGPVPDPVVPEGLPIDAGEIRAVEIGADENASCSAAGVSDDSAIHLMVG